MRIETMRPAKAPFVLAREAGIEVAVRTM